jgi:hypothetical protein
MKKGGLPTGWTEKRIRALAAYHDSLAIDEQAAEIKTALNGWNKRSKRVRLKQVHEEPDGRP